MNVVKGGERGTNNLFSCSLYILGGLAAGCGAHGQNPLNSVSVKGAHDGGGASTLIFAEEVETLLSLLSKRCSVVGPGEVLGDVHTQELGVA